MNTIAAFPGTPQHQALLRAIVSRYEKDPRILAVAVFGSLARGNWDAYSDIDCDIVVADDERIDPVHEFHSLGDAFASVGEEIAFIVPINDDAGDIQLCSLMQLSIRYHPLAQTSPNIVRDMMVLAGQLDHASIVRAGEGNRETAPSELTESVDVLVRYAVVANTCIQRSQVWSALEILHRMRGILMYLFALTHGGERAYQFFDDHAPEELQAQLGATLSSNYTDSLRVSLTRLLDILDRDLGSLADSQVRLTDAHRIVLNNVREQITSKKTAQNGVETEG
jgi:predicted nucleotidyltransferase